MEQNQSHRKQHWNTVSNFCNYLIFYFILFYLLKNKNKSVKPEIRLLLNEGTLAIKMYLSPVQPNSISRLRS